MLDWIIVRWNIVYHLLNYFYLQNKFLSYEKARYDEHARTNVKTVKLNDEPAGAVYHIIWFKIVSYHIIQKCIIKYSIISFYTISYNIIIQYLMLMQFILYYTIWYCSIVNFVYRWKLYHIIPYQNLHIIWYYKVLCTITL